MIFQPTKWLNKLFWRSDCLEAILTLIGYIWCATIRLYHLILLTVFWIHRLGKSTCFIGLASCQLRDHFGLHQSKACSNRFQRGPMCHLSLSKFATHIFSLIKYFLQQAFLSVFLVWRQAKFSIALPSRWRLFPSAEPSFETEVLNAFRSWNGIALERNLLDEKRNISEQF